MRQCHVRVDKVNSRLCCIAQLKNAKQEKRSTSLDKAEGVRVPMLVAHCPGWPLRHHRPAPIQAPACESLKPGNSETRDVRERETSERERGRGRCALIKWSRQCRFQALDHLTTRAPHSRTTYFVARLHGNQPYSNIRYCPRSNLCCCSAATNSTFDRVAMTTASVAAMPTTILTPLVTLTPRALCRAPLDPHLLALPYGRRCRCRPPALSHARRTPARRPVPMAMATLTPPPGSNSPPQAQPQPQQLYPGTYGPWSVESSDVREVVLYRAGLVTAATTFIAAASTALLPDDNAVKSVIRSLYDPLYVVGAGGLGASLILIHIYVTPIKRALQALWAVGVLGSLGVAVNFAAPANQGLVEFVLNNSAGIWAVGPLFASLTGLVFKEGLCYGKLEAAALVLVIPSLLLGRLSGVMDEKVQLGLLAAWMALFAVFASRKFTQPIKDDIGDKSIFIFNALPKDDQQALLLQLQEQQALQKE